MRLSIATAIAIGSRIATADPIRTDADEAFEQGGALLKAGKLDEACAAFDKSLSLEFAYGTLYSLATCESRRGRVLAAWTAFRRLAEQDTNAGRRARSSELASELEPQVPKLVVELDRKTPAGLVVKLDGKAIDYLARLPIEIGAHEIEAAAPGFTTWHAKFEASASATLTIKPALEARASAVAAAPARRRFARSHPIIGGAAFVAGAVSLAGGIALALDAKYQFDASKTAALTGDSSALSRNRQAVTLGNVATVLAIAGLVTAPIGVLVWRRGTLVIAPAAIAMRGRF